MKKERYFKIRKEERYCQIGRRRDIISKEKKRYYQQGEEEIGKKRDSIR